MSREILTKGLDAAGNAVTGLPASSAASDAVRRDEMLAGDASAIVTSESFATAGDVVVAASVTAEAVARAAADAAEAASRIAGDAATLATAEAFTTSSLAAQVFGTASSTTLQAIDVSVINEGAIRIVATYMAPWKLVDGTVRTRTTIPHRVLPASGRTNWWWVRIVCDGDPYWQAQTVWYMDPAGTNATPGDDEADGLSSSSPLKSMAEWRRRIQGAAFTGNGPVIHALSGSSVADDGMFCGFTTPGLTTYVRLLGTPVTTGLSGTVSSYVAYSGNTRGQFTDSSVPASWTASGAISSSTGSRFVRKTGTGVRHYAPLLKDLGSKTVQFGIVVDWDETDAVTTRQTETNFANGDTYEVVSLPTWPSVQTLGGNVIVQCFDLLGLATPQFAQSISDAGQLRYRLCGFHQNQSFVSNNAIVIYSSVFCATPPAGLGATGAGILLINSAVTNGLVQFNYGAWDWGVNAPNVIVNSEFRLWHGFTAASLGGGLRCFDCVAPLVSVRHRSTIKLTGTIVGSGNSGSFVQADSGSIFYGAANITATTSKAFPWSVNLVDYAAPVVDAGSGDGIYN
jgi:hypothetical protein